MTLAVILAGGDGSRMGGNKPLHAFGDGTLIEAVIARLKPQTTNLHLNAGHRGHPLAQRLSRLSLAQLGRPPLFDPPPLCRLGPLCGVLAALNAGRNLGARHVVTVPCDMPRLPADLVRVLSAAPPADAAFIRAGRDHPLCARWSVDVTDHLAEALALARPRGGLSVMTFLDGLYTVRASHADTAAFVNVNTPGDL